MAAREGADALPGLRRQADQLEDVGDVATTPVARPVQLERLADVELALDPGRLQHDPDPITQLAPASARVGAEHRHLTGRAVTMTLEDLDRCRLPGAVVPEQRVHLARPHVERQVVDGDDRPVRLAQPSHLGSRPCGREPTVRRTRPT